MLSARMQENANMRKYNPGRSENIKVGDTDVEKTNWGPAKKMYRSHILCGCVQKIIGNHYLIPSTINSDVHWYTVSNVKVSPTRAETLRKYYMPMGPADANFESYTVVLNPSGDGSCQFVAVADQLTTFGIYRSPETLGAEVVRYISENNQMFSVFTEGGWSRYIHTMSRTSRFGNDLTLQSVTDIFATRIHIVIPNGVKYCSLYPTHILSPFKQST